MRLRSSSVRLHSLFRQQGERLNFVKNKHYAQTSSEKWTLGKVVKLRCSDNDSIFGLRFYPIFLLYVLLYGLEPVRYGFILAALCQYFYMARIHRLQRVQNGRSRKFSTHQHGSIRSSSAISSEMAWSRKPQDSETIVKRRRRRPFGYVARLDPAHIASLACSLCPYHVMPWAGVPLAPSRVGFPRTTWIPRISSDIDWSCTDAHNPSINRSTWRALVTTETQSD